MVSNLRAYTSGYVSFFRLDGSGSTGHFQFYINRQEIRQIRADGLCCRAIGIPRYWPGSMVTRVRTFDNPRITNGITTLSHHRPSQFRRYNQQPALRHGTQKQDRFPIQLNNYDTHRNVSALGRITMQTLGRNLFANSKCARCRTRARQPSRFHFLPQYYGQTQLGAIRRKAGSMSGTRFDFRARRSTSRVTRKI